jgi:hypothetical protein
MTEFDIPAEQREQMLTDRIASLNLDGFQNELNLKVAIAADEESVIEMAQENLRQIKIAIAVLTDELNGVTIDPAHEPVTDPELVEDAPTNIN